MALMARLRHVIVATAFILTREAVGGCYVMPIRAMPHIMKKTLSILVIMADAYEMVMRPRHVTFIIFTGRRIIRRHLSHMMFIAPLTYDVVTTPCLSHTIFGLLETIMVASAVVTAIFIVGNGAVVMLVNSGLTSRIFAIILSSYTHCFAPIRRWIKDGNIVAALALQTR